MSLSLSKAARSITPSATLKINAAAAALRAQGIPVLSLGAGEPDFATPKHIREAAVHALESGFTRYTDVSGIPQLRQAVCKHLKAQKNLSYAPDEILAGAGAKQMIYEALQAILDPDDEVLLPAPYWVSYPEMIRLAGGVPVVVDSCAQQHFLPGAHDLAARISRRTKALIINTPGNPSGAVWPCSLIQEVMQLAQAHDFFVISDEIYEDLLYDDLKHISPAAVSEDAHRRTIIVSGFSKAYAMTGWRIGYAAGPRNVIAAMAALQSHETGNACSLSQYAALSALEGPQDCVKQMACAFAARRSLLLSCLEAEGLSPALLPQGAFYLLLDIRPFLGKCAGGISITDDALFCERLLTDAHVAVTPGSAFGIPGYIRLSYALQEDGIREAARRIGQFTRNLK